MSAHNVTDLETVLAAALRSSTPQQQRACLQTKDQALLLLCSKLERNPAARQALTAAPIFAACYLPCVAQSQMEQTSSSSQLQGPTRQILRTIYHKWHRQIQRWDDYRSLFSLMAFTAVFLWVLYAQRGATVGYQVHSTIAAVVMPGSSVLQSTADVYSWLQNLLQVRS